MSVRQLWEGCDAAVWARKLDGRTKLLILFLVAVLAIVVDNPRTLFLLFTATLLLHLSARTSIYKWQVLAILLLLGLWGSMFSQALFFAQTPRTPLFVIIEPTMPVLGQITGGLYIYREGVIYGAVQGVKVSYDVVLRVICLLDFRSTSIAESSYHLETISADSVYACDGDTIFASAGC